MNGDMPTILYPQKKVQRHYRHYRCLYQNNVISATCEMIVGNTTCTLLLLNIFTICAEQNTLSPITFMTSRFSLLSFFCQSFQDIPENIWNQFWQNKTVASMIK